MNREHKGKSNLIFFDEYVVLDIETTGLSPGFDEIIEIGAAKVTRNGITEEFERLIKPRRSIPAFITELTGISDSTVKNAKRAKYVLSEFSDFLGDSFIVGQNVNFDINFLYDSMLSNLHSPLENDFADTMRLSRNIFPKLSDHKLSTLKKAFKIKNTVAHRGLSDSLDTMKCYEYMRKFCEENDLADVHKFGLKLNKKKLAAFLDGDDKCSTAKNAK